MTLTDSHAHLEMADFDGDRDEVLARARKKGVTTVITVGTTPDEWEKAVSLTKRYEGVYAALGLHPHEAKRGGPKVYDTLRALCADERIVAYGEIGLDFFRNLSPRATQIRVFGEQLDLAADLDLPIIVHDREAHSETLAMLKGWKGKRGGVIHCFSGDRAMAEKVLEMGFYISIAGPVTYNKAHRLQEVARMVPLNRLLIETDAPYLTPAPLRGRRNEPAFIIHTAAEIGRLRDLTVEEIGAVSTENSRRLFGIA